MNLRHDRTVGWNLSCLGLQSIPRDSVTQCLFCRDITGRKRCATSKDYKTSSSPGLLAPMDALTVLPERLFAIRCICRTIGLQFVINSLLLYLKYLGFIKWNINTRVNTWFVNLHVLLITFDSTQPSLKLTQNVTQRPSQRCVTTHTMKAKESTVPGLQSSNYYRNILKGLTETATQI